MKISRTIVTVAVAVIIAFALAKAFSGIATYYHVTCPDGLFEGDVRQTFNGNYSVETGNRLYLPDNCVMERLPIE